MGEGLLNGLALCTGIGGFELGMRLAIGPTYRTVCFVEKDPARIGYIVSRFEELDEAPIWDDICTFDGMPWNGVVDIITAGFPCRPYSTAARGRNAKPTLWKEIVRITREVRPHAVFLENVPRSRGDLLLVRNNFIGMGYCVLPIYTVSAAAMAAPFLGWRSFLLAASDPGIKSALAVYDEMAREPYPQESWWDDIDRIRDMDDGLPGRMVERGALGDAVVPLVAAHAFRTLAKEL